MSREFKLTQDGRIVASFLHMLKNDYEFDATQPMTDTYLFDVGREIGFNQNETMIIVDILKEKGLITE